MTALAARGVALEDIGVRRPSLDEVHLVLTGHGEPAQPTPEVAA